MSGNVDPENTTITTPRGGKKMKKRKELDALLMNGKKSRPKRSKDGHELLQNMDSESNSSELDEFIVQTRKQTTRRRKGVICSLCLRLLVFILVVGCITVTVGVMWMHLELKSDLDSLRKQLTDVQTLMDNSQAESSSTAELNNRMFYSSIPGLTTKVGFLNESISSLNESIASLRIDIHSLQESAAAHDEQEARNLEDINQLKLKLKSLKVDAAANQSSLSTLISTLKNNLSTLQTQVADLSQKQPNVPPANQPSSPPVVQPVSDEAVQSLQKSIDSLDSSFSELNQTVVHLSTEVTSMKASTGTGAPVSQPAGGSVNVTGVLATLQKNVDHLMDVVNREVSSDEQTDATPGDTPPDSWQAQVDSRLGIIENQVKELSPDDLNNNLLNNATTRGIQTILEKTYKGFREEIEGDLTTLQTDHQTVMARIVTNERAFAGVTDSMVDLELRVIALEGNNTLPPVVASPSPNISDITQGVSPPVVPTTEAEEPTSPPEEGGETTIKPEPETVQPEQEGEGGEKPDGQDSNGEPPTGPNEGTSPKPEGLEAEPSGVQNPADKPPTTAAPAGADTHDDEPPTEEKPVESPINGTLTGDAPNEEPAKNEEPVGNPGDQSSSEVATTSEPELDTQLSLLTGTANVSRSMRSTSFNMDITDELISTDGVETTTADITTKLLKTTRAPPPILRIKGVTSQQALKKLFRAWDRNHDYKLTYHELSRISNFGDKPPPQVDFLAYDQDGDSELSKTEMAAAMHL